MRFLHIIVTHLEPEKVRKHLELTRLFTPGVRHLIAYGGPRETFTRLQAEDKLFLEDKSLRGPTMEQCFNELFPKVWEYTQRQGIEFDFAHVSEYDHLVLRPDYFDLIEAALACSGADFLGKACGTKARSNWPHRFRAERDGALLDFLRIHSVRRDKTEILGTLGNGVVLSREVVQAWAALDGLPKVYNELIFATLTHHLGFKIGDMGSFSDVFTHVRWFPPWKPNELEGLARRGVACVHPFKEIDEAEAILRSLAKKGAAMATPASVPRML